MPNRSAKNILALLLACASFALIIHAQPRIKQSSKEKLTPLTSRVILICIAGLSANDLGSSSPMSRHAPNLREMRAGGAFALNVESVYPTQTLPALATIFTGMLPIDHGITADVVFDADDFGKPANNLRQTSTIKTDTLWDAARRAGLKTAAVGFPFAAGLVAVDYTKQGAAETSAARSERLADLKQQDQSRARTATELIQQKHPQLMLIYFDSYAQAQRRFGVHSKEAAETLENLDSLLKEILESADGNGSAGNAVVLVVSDHGMAKVEHEFHPNVVLRRKSLLKTDESGKITSWRAVAQALGGAAAIFLENPQDEVTAREVEAAFREIHEQTSSPIWRIVTRRDTIRLGADPRAFLYLDAAPGFTMSDSAENGSVSKVGPETGRAVGGYLPQRLEMRAAFVAFGHGIKPKSQLEYVRLIDVAPTVARLLGFELRATRGRILTEILDQSNGHEKNQG